MPSLCKVRCVRIFTKKKNDSHKVSNGCGTRVDGRPVWGRTLVFHYTIGTTTRDAANTFHHVRWTFFGTYLSFRKKTQVAPSGCATRATMVKSAKHTKVGGGQLGRCPLCLSSHRHDRACRPSVVSPSQCCKVIVRVTIQHTNGLVMTRRTIQSMVAIECKKRVALRKRKLSHNVVTESSKRAESGLYGCIKLAKLRCASSIVGVIRPLLNGGIVVLADVEPPVSGMVTTMPATGCVSVVVVSLLRCFILHLLLVRSPASTYRNHFTVSTPPL
jgi:hypothetical protein